MPPAARCQGEQGEHFRFHKLNRRACPLTSALGQSAEISRHRRFHSAADTHRDRRHLRSAGSGQQGKSQKQSARTDQEMADGAIKRGD
jgi:hypothetical protein